MGTTPSDTDSIKILFKEIDTNDSIQIICFLYEKISEVIKRYKEKRYYKDKNKKFLFKGKILDETLTVSEAGIFDGAIIIIVTFSLNKEKEMLEHEFEKNLIKNNLSIENCCCEHMNENKFNKRRETTHFENEMDSDNDECFMIEKSNLDMEINIKFIKMNQIYKINNLQNLSGLLKLCLLKEIALKINNLDSLPDNLKVLVQILKNGKITYETPKSGILEVLKKIKGNSIYNYSKFIDPMITNSDINILKNNITYSNDKKEIEEIHYILGRYIPYMKMFEEEFERAKNESIFEYSIISLAIIDRKDLDTFENERDKCPNRKDRVLFHGTGINPIEINGEIKYPIPEILDTMFKNSRAIQYGGGVYFTDILDYAWYYGGEDNRANLKKIPKVGGILRMIPTAIYYNSKKLNWVNDWKYTPEKNEINFAIAKADTHNIDYDYYLKLKKDSRNIDDDLKIDKSLFFGREFVIQDKNQLCPFMSATLKRSEYCVIWRDTNFSSEPVYNNKFDPIFKSFLAKRYQYCLGQAKYNVYPCETSEEALKLIKMKKYGKIILISNVGTDLGGKKFIEEARKILGNNIIVLFLAYNIKHLNWIKNFKNAIFSNDPNFYEKYIESFTEGDTSDTKNNLDNLIKELEKHYKVKFDFDKTYLNYPYFKENGEFKDLIFN